MAVKNYKVLKSHVTPELYDFYHTPETVAMIDLLNCKSQELKKTFAAVTFSSQNWGIKIQQNLSCLDEEKERGSFFILACWLAFTNTGLMLHHPRKSFKQVNNLICGS